MDPELEKYFMPDTVSRPHPFKHSAPIADDELYDPKKLIENIERLSVIRESLEEDKKVDKERIRQVFNISHFDMTSYSMSFVYRSLQDLSKCTITLCS